MHPGAAIRLVAPEDCSRIYEQAAKNGYGNAGHAYDGYPGAAGAVGGAGERVTPVLDEDVSDQLGQIVHVANANNLPGCDNRVRSAQLYASCGFPLPDGADAVQRLIEW